MFLVLLFVLLLPVLFAVLYVVYGQVLLYRRDRRRRMEAAEVEATAPNEDEDITMGERKAIRK